MVGPGLDAWFAGHPAIDGLGHPRMNRIPSAVMLIGLSILIREVEYSAIIHRRAGRLKFVGNGLIGQNVIDLFP